ncbi:DoxX family protein [Stackebrandtia soli]|uniref:DoxX family protein n=1 Tax=Stackebrandtia soli TaxID=1892856 RepID=UPI0039ED0C4B
MNLALWITQAFLALAFVVVGLMKATRPISTIAPSMPWVEDYSPITVRLIGAIEVVGAIGLILPGVTGVATVLTPISATGLALIMVLAAIVHARRKEGGAIVLNVVLLAASAFVAWEQFGRYAG